MHNHRILTEAGPLWVVLGDSTAQGLGAPSPEGGYVGQALAELRLRTGQRWRVLNLSTSGALIRDVLGGQLPRVPSGTVLLDLPLPAGMWGLLGRLSQPYLARVNRVIHQGAAARGLPVAEVSAHFRPPWPGKFAADRFHPSQAGYRDWSRALLAALR